ncbi:MAG: hypothetical protein H6659_08765 [Ardenticatenaceae bacterium]|nr:hypothetical protein [Ardenticatenaceae bacterium]MCB8988542.1 hypothetical protein [Ardenticatenaceae bacterium]
MLSRVAGTSNKRVHVVSVVLYAVGFLIGLELALGTIWANLEASLFDAAIRQEARLTSLRCPPLISPTETALVRANFHNGSEKALNFLVRANISNGRVTLMRHIPTTLRLEPGQQELLAWPVTAADAAFGRFVLVRVTVLSSPPYPARDAACGVLLLNVPPLSGRQMVALALLVSLGGMGGGLALRVWNERPLTGRRRSHTLAALWLAVLVVALILAGLLRLWAVGVILLAFLVLLLAVFLERAVHQP